VCSSDILIVVGSVYRTREKEKLDAMGYRTRAKEKLDAMGYRTRAKEKGKSKKI
jgi:hypothetical protein